ncbi:MAG: anthranilate synthase component I family protein, partial [Ignavibacteria bacterium]|nr:anthranilate synthase component I family protein [Ignavibacteria bacterium]
TSKKSLLAFPEILFFVPEIIITLKGNQLTIITNENHQELFDEMLSTEKINQQQTNVAAIQHRTKKEKYLQHIESIKQQIIDGDFYELNYCVEFFAENVSINPYQLHHSICNISPAPFSAFMKLKDKFIICSSPERFLKKENNKLISQPIKGTRRRITNDKTADQKLMNELIHSEKERAENLMIVDLVRNDLNRTAKTGTVTVEELCKIYSYPQVHQMISTITSELAHNINSIDALKLAFPMGSMTGAPKTEVMKAIDHYEDVSRGVYSGAIGYFDPEDNFDFNVVIRTILYNQSSGYLSFHAGAAITADSIAEEEYEECLIKAAAMMKVLE